MGWAIVILGGILVAGGWAWYRWGSTSTVGTSTAGQAVTKALDTAGAMSAYASLTAIRTLDSVEADPAAVAACDLLRDVVTRWKRPAPVVVAPVTTTPTIDQLAAELAAVKKQVASQSTGTSTIPAASVAPVVQNTTV